MTKSSFWFRLFLVGYLVLLGAHLLHDLEHAGEWELIACVLGAAFALFAHSRAGPLLLVLLTMHMATEWIGYGLSGFSTTPRGWALQAIHIGMDAILAWIALANTFPRRVGILYSALLTGLAVMYATASVVGHPAGETHTHGGAFELLVLGGIMGCSIYHLAKGTMRA